ncbi:MAG: DUF4091 domain-containing protein [Pirellulaceae bacterium]|nr:DUF4091 domain-containing protein [Pirellulaceae bacterium]
MAKWLILSVLMGAAVPAEKLPSEGINLALGKVAKFDPAPNYEDYQPEAVAGVLCDGIYNGCRWGKAGTVGWTNLDRIKLIDIDLGEAQPIGKVTFDTITGLASQVTFPDAVLVFCSVDGQQYHYLCDVLTESLPQQKAINHRFSAEGLKGWGRFVRLAVISGGFYVFCDEIEILQGEHQQDAAVFLDSEPIPADSVRDEAMKRSDWATRKNATLTLLREAETALALRAPLLEDAQLFAETQDVLEDGRKSILNDPSVTTPDFSRGPPYGMIDSRAFSAIGKINAMLWPDKSAVVWHTNDWDWLHPLDAPLGTETNPSIHVDMMQNEWATASFVVTSAADQMQQLSISMDVFDGPTPIPSEQVLEIAHVVHVEAMGFNYRDDAIVPMNSATVDLSPGIAKRIWLTFKTRGLTIAPGTYSTELSVDVDGKSVAMVPLTLRVWPIRFPDDVSLHSNTWGYFDRSTVQGLERAAARDLADHYNTAFTLHHSWIPYPQVDSEGNFTEPLDFTRMDQMLEWCPEVRLWLIWPGFEWGFCRLGTKEYGSSVWEKVFTRWVTEIRDHLAERGIGKESFAWYWLDEANSGEEWEELCLRPSKLVKSIDPEMQVWTNPKARTAQGVKEIEAGLPYFDMYCPVLASITRNRKVLDICHRTRCKSWTYVCSSEKNRDPFAYYRWFSWNAWKLGLGGIGMWVYVDDSNMTFSDYTHGVSYGMVYRGDQTIIASKRWEAWRQGIADYEYLRMLRDAVTEKKNTQQDSVWIRKADRILNDGVDEIVVTGQLGDPSARAVPDDLRVQILECLAGLQNETSSP